MSAVILPFKGKWQSSSRDIPQDRKVAAEARGLHDARLIRAAKRENDDWTARLLLAMLQSLDRKQLELIEFRLCGPTIDSKSAVQALAIVQLATGNNAHREHVRGHLDALAAREDGE